MAREYVGGGAHLDLDAKEIGEEEGALSPRGGKLSRK